MKQLALALGAIAVVASSYLLEGSSLPAFAVFGVFTFSPWALLALNAGRLGPVAGRITLGLLTAMSVGMIALVASDDSSTGVLGLVFLVVYQWMVVGAVIFGGAAVARWRRRGA